MGRLRGAVGARHSHLWPPPAAFLHPLLCIRCAGAAREKAGPLRAGAPEFPPPLRQAGEFHACRASIPSAAGPSGPSPLLPVRAPLRRRLPGCLRVMLLPALLVPDHSERRSGAG